MDESDEVAGERKGGTGLVRQKRMKKFFWLIK